MKVNNFAWTVIGAGPAGIAAVGQLLDAGIPATRIAWIDPTFTVGELGTSWKRVMSNTPAESFMKVYQAFDSFEFSQCQEKFMIKRLNPENRCPLILAAQPLQWITERLKTKVTAIIGMVEKLCQTTHGWQLQLASGQCLNTQKVILALGAESMTIPYPSLTTISLKTAANSTLLERAGDPEECIAVFGAYQSARTVQENLAKVKVKKIIHFHRSERSFEQHIASLNLGDHVETYPITPLNLLKHIPRCNKVIYAIGFVRRPIRIEGFPDDFSYDKQTGWIAPGVYGLGIAFPEIIPYTMGRLEYKVSALWPVVKYLKKVFPNWLQESVLESPQGDRRAAIVADALDSDLEMIV